MKKNIVLRLFLLLAFITSMFAAPIVPPVSAQSQDEDKLVAYCDEEVPCVVITQENVRKLQALTNFNDKQIKYGGLMNVRELAVIPQGNIMRWPAFKYNYVPAEVHIVRGKFISVPQMGIKINPWYITDEKDQIITDYRKLWLGENHITENDLYTSVSNDGTRKMIWRWYVELTDTNYGEIVLHVTNLYFAVRTPADSRQGRLLTWNTLEPQDWDQYTSDGQVKNCLMEYSYDGESWKSLDVHIIGMPKNVFSFFIRRTDCYGMPTAKVAWFDENQTTLDGFEFEIAATETMNVDLMAGKRFASSIAFIFGGQRFEFQQATSEEVNASISGCSVIYTHDGEVYTASTNETNPLFDGMRFYLPGCKAGYMLSPFDAYGYMQHGEIGTTSSGMISTFGGKITSAILKLNMVDDTYKFEVPEIPSETPQSCK